MYQKQPSEKAVWDMGLINPHGLCFKIRKKKNLLFQTAVWLC